MTLLQRPCLPWDGHIDKDGYGRTGSRSGQQLAHRQAWEEANNADLPEGMTVDHLCHNLDPTCRGDGPLCPHRRCIEPTHLELVTQSVNSKRRWKAARENQ